MNVRPILIGSLGFAVVSVVAFSLWAFGGRWFHAHGGDAAMYPAIALVFIGLTGLVLRPLVPGDRALTRFYGAFVPAFLIYAVVWCLAWFVIKREAGEWIGSFLGSLAFAVVVMKRMGAKSAFLMTGFFVFAMHSLGYFLGGKVMYGILGGCCDEWFTAWTREQIKIVAMLGWGLLYGLGFGAGIGLAFDQAQRGLNEQPRG